MSKWLKNHSILNVDINIVDSHKSQLRWSPSSSPETATAQFFNVVLSTWHCAVRHAVVRKNCHTALYGAPEVVHCAVRRVAPRTLYSPVLGHKKCWLWKFTYTSSATSVVYWFNYWKKCTWNSRKSIVSEGRKETVRKWKSRKENTSKNSFLQEWVSRKAKPRKVRKSNV